MLIIVEIEKKIIGKKNLLFFVRLFGFWEKKRNVYEFLMIIIWDYNIFFCFINKLRFFKNKNGMKFFCCVAFSSFSILFCCLFDCRNFTKQHNHKSLKISKVFTTTKKGEIIHIIQNKLFYTDYINTFRRKILSEYTKAYKPLKRDCYYY